MATPGRFISRDINASKIVALEKEKSELKKEMDQTKKDKELLLTKISTLEKDKSDLSSQLNTLKVGKEDVQKELNAVKSERSNLQSRVNSLESEKGILSKQLADIESEKANLNAQLSTHKTNIDQIQKQSTLLKADVTNLQNKIKTLETEKTTLQNEKIALYNNLETLKSAAPSSARAEVLEKELGAVKLEKSNLITQTSDYKLKLEQAINEKQNLADQIENLKKAGPTVKIEDMTSVFKSTLASLQRGIKEPEKPGEVGYIIDKFEVEMKSGLDMREGIKLVQPTAAELKPEGLSTVRISFKAKPTLKIAEE